MHGTHQRNNADSSLWGERQGIWSSSYAIELYLHSLYRTFAFIGGFGTEIAGKDQSDAGTRLLVIFFCVVGLIVRIYIVSQAYMLVQIIYSSSMKVRKIILRAALQIRNYSYNFVPVKH